jgi:hypothetical protein
METVWEDNSPHATFWRKLLNQRVDLLVNSPTWLKSLRHRWEEVRWWQKRAGKIFEERGINLYQLIAEAHGECWDAEDEEKCANAVSENVAPPMLNKKPRQNDAICMDHTREISLRQGEKEEL